jgi:diguanylate cyclase (GGDEF)-like protein
MVGELEHQAFHDGLTNLPNRALFRERVGHALRRRSQAGTPLALLFIDLDDFKTVNDTLGHTVGDTLLAQVAQRLRGCLRSTDTPARFGGDEFAILVQDHADVRGAAQSVAARLLHLLDEPFDLAGTPFYLRCSIGIAVGGASADMSGGSAADTAAAALLRDADIAMYVAKASGKNRFELFTPDMAGMVEQDLDARQELAAALARDEFELHYQPIVALPSQEIHTVEALIRWRHPERGLLFPGQFLPQAERCRLLADLERWVIVAACQEAARWGDESAPAVSVNICPRHLARTWLVPTVRQALSVSGLPGHRLILEITEEALIADPATAEANLRACVELGV